MGTVRSCAHSSLLQEKEPWQNSPFDLLLCNMCVVSGFAIKGNIKKLITPVTFCPREERSSHDIFGSRVDFIVILISFGRGQGRSLVRQSTKTENEGRELDTQGRVAPQPPPQPPPG